MKTTFFILENLCIDKKLSRRYVSRYRKNTTIFDFFTALYLSDWTEGSVLAETGLQETVAQRESATAAGQRDVFPLQDEATAIVQGPTFSVWGDPGHQNCRESKSTAEGVVRCTLNMTAFLISHFGKNNFRNILYP